MPIDTVDGLVEDLRKNKLLRASQQDELERMLVPRFPGTQALAKELVRRGWLTVYQMNQLFQANGQRLILGPFQILDHLGKGGVSQVFKAWHTTRECLVALKVIHPHLVSNAEALGRFQREMKAVARLSHPNIVQSFEADPLGQAQFFAMEYVQGIDLNRHVQRAGALPVEEACDFIRQAASGLAHAHQQGLVHRDIKPANMVLLQDTRRLKVLDFGLARLLTPGEGPTSQQAALTAQGALIGTPDYVAPEQARDARSADIRADIYSLGCTFYYFLAAAPPFPGGSALQKIHNHLNKEPTTITILRPDLPAGAERILKKMMAKKPEERFQTPAELEEALKPFCGNASV